MMKNFDCKIDNKFDETSSVTDHSENLNFCLIFLIKNM